MRYHVETLVMLVLVPFAVLILLALLAVSMCRRIYPRRLERLHEFDPEPDAINGLITSNTGDGMLAVSLLVSVYMWCESSAVI